MTCTACIGIEVKQVVLPRVEWINKLAVIEAAYEAVNAVYWPIYAAAHSWSMNSTFRKSVESIWKQGPCVVKIRTKIAPVVMVRQLLAYHLDKNNVKMSEIAEIMGNLHRTTGIHHRDVFKGRIECDFYTFEKKVYDYFQKLVGMPAA